MAACRECHRDMTQKKLGLNKAQPIQIQQRSPSEIENYEPITAKRPKILA